MTKFLFCLFALIALIGPSTALATSASSFEAAELYGDWQVVGVAVPENGVQALAEDDPTYMAHRFQLRSDRFAMDDASEESTERPCLAPEVRAAVADTGSQGERTPRWGEVVRTFSVVCRSGPWGPWEPPSPTILVLRDKTIVLRWFDGALLHLRRTN